MFAGMPVIWWAIAAALASAATARCNSFPGCDRHYWMCDSGQCLQGAYLCDGDRDCPGGEDESSDVCGNCTATSIYCHSSRRCISYLFMCDGSPQCPRAEDESKDRCFDVPARQEGVTCNATTMSIRVRAHGAGERVFIYNSACILHNKGGRTHEGSFALNDCGIGKRAEGSTAVYYAYLLAVGAGEDIVDSADSLRLVECRYRATVNKTNAVGFEPGVAGAPTGLPPLTGSPRANVTGVVMRQFESAAFDRAYNDSVYPLRLHIGSLMHVQIRALGDTEAVQVSLKSCRAYSGVAGTEQRREHVLVRDGCVTSKSFAYLPSPSSAEIRFSLKAFVLVGSSGPIYLDCDVGVCDRGNDLCGAAAGCQSGRRKRSLQFDQIFSARLGPVVLQ